jgi:hypothetical protein
VIPALAIVLLFVVLSTPHPVLDRGSPTVAATPR